MKRLLLLGIFLVLCLAVQGQAQDEVKLTWRPLPFVPEPPYIILEVEFPHDLEKPQENITVNGKRAFFKAAGGGGSPAGQRRDYYVYVGEPGKKELKVTLSTPGRSLAASTQIDFRSRGGILPLNLAPGEGVFAPGEWRLYVYFLQDIRVQLNGADLPYRLTPLEASTGHHLLTLTPPLTAGRNTVAISGTNPQGETLSVTVPVYFLKENTVKAGEVFWFPMGEVGSKSGPFYRLVVEGTAIQPLQQTFQRRLTLTDNLWLGGVDLFSQELKAVAPGAATLKVMEKRWFRDPGYRLKASYTLRVVP